MDTVVGYNKLRNLQNIDNLYYEIMKDLLEPKIKLNNNWITNKKGSGTFRKIVDFCKSL